MDPNANLHEVRLLVQRVIRIWESVSDDEQFTSKQTIDITHAGYDLAKCVELLDGWAVDGIFPDAWATKGRKA